MATATDSFENDIINHFMRGQSVSASSAYLALSTTEPLEDGTNFTEPSTSDGYSRQLISLSEPSDGFTQTDTSTTFGPCTNNNWGDITYLGIFFASSGGDLKMFKPIVTTTVNVGQSVSWNAGNLSVTVS